MSKRAARVKRELHRVNGPDRGHGWAARQAAKRQDHKSGTVLGRRNSSRSRGFARKK